MSQVQDFSGWDPDLIPTAIVWARCSDTSHLGPLAAWATFRTGRVVLWDATGYQRPQYVGPFAAPGTDERDEILRTFQEEGIPFGAGNLPVAAGPEGEPGYWREVIVCTQPECTYRVELAEQGGRDVRSLVRGLADAHGQVIQTDASKVPSEDVELHSFLRAAAARRSSSQDHPGPALG